MKEPVHGFLRVNFLKSGKSESRQHLWLYGIPGCGKTVLSSTIIEHLRQNRKDSSHIVLDFFFDFSDARKQSVDQLIRSLVAQLYSRHEHSRKELNILLSKCGGRQQPTTESLFATLQGMMRSAKKVQIVIDALDECQTRKDLLSWLQKLASSGDRNIYLLATSQREQELESGLASRGSENSFIPIQQDPVDSDICACVHGVLRGENEFQRWRKQPKVLEEIETGLMKKAHGM